MVMLICTTVCILFDIVSGLIKALYFGNVNSTYLRKGLLHKATEVLTICGAALLEYGMQYINLGFDLPLLKTVGIYICAMEIVSVLENIGEVNPKLGNFLKPYLEKLKLKEGEAENEGTI